MKHMPPTGRDTLLSLNEEDRMRYPPMKAHLVQKFGLTQEKHRLKFRDNQKLSTQNWVDYVAHFTKALDGW